MRAFALVFVAACSSAPLVLSDAATEGGPSFGDSGVHDAGPASDAMLDAGDATSIFDASTDALADAPADVSADISSGTFMVNEIYVGSGVTGDANRYIEIVGPAGASLSDLQIRILEAQGSSTVVAYAVMLTSSNAVMPSSGRWVIGGALVSNVNEFYSIGEFGMHSARGAVQLVRMTGMNATLLDVVGYGSPSLAAPSAAPFETFEGAVASVPSGDTRAMGRLSGAVDTNQNANDFCAVAKSPGVANGACVP